MLQGDCDQIGSGGLELLAGSEEGDGRVRALVQQVLGAIRNLWILLHDHLDVVLIAPRLGELDDLRHEIDRRQRPDAADHTDLERPARAMGWLAQGIIRIAAVDVEDRDRERRRQCSMH